jgi:hypothetical protein
VLEAYLGLWAERLDECTVALHEFRVLRLHELDEADFELTTRLSLVEDVAAVQLDARRGRLVRLARDDTAIVVAVPGGGLVGLLSGRVGGGW